MPYINIIIGIFTVPSALIRLGQAKPLRLHNPQINISIAGQLDNLRSFAKHFLIFRMFPEYFADELMRKQ